MTDYPDSPWWMEGSIDLGGGYWVKFYEDDLGLHVIHPRPDGGELCLGGVNFRPGGWILECRDPITISHSIHCMACGAHGFIRGSKWVPAQ